MTFHDTVDIQHDICNTVVVLSRHGNLIIAVVLQSSLSYAIEVPSRFPAAHDTKAFVGGHHQREALVQEIFSNGENADIFIFLTMEISVKFDPHLDGVRFDGENVLHL